MPHIHDLIDFTVGAYIVYQDKVLLIHHKKLDMWVCIGGHIELDEDSDQALFREIKEETGLTPDQYQVLCDRSPINQPPQIKSLFTPSFVDMHQINDTHRHLTFFYFIRSTTDKVTLAAEEHRQIKWFSKEELEDPQYALWDSVKFYCKAALTAAAEQ